MGLFDKIKEILFVEEEEELPVITKKEEKKEDGRSIQDDIPSRSRNLKRDIEPAIGSEENTKEYKREEPRKNSPFLSFDEAEFERVNHPNNPPRPVPPKAGPPKVPMANSRPRNDEVIKTTTTNIKKVDYKDYSRYEMTKTVEEKKPFRPSPVISPVYGILDKNYRKEDVVTKQKTENTLIRDVDSIRKKAFGELEDIEMPEIKKNVEEEKSIDDLILQEFEQPVEDVKVEDNAVVDDVIVNSINEEDMVDNIEPIITHYDDEDNEEEEDTSNEGYQPVNEHTSALEILDEIEKELNKQDSTESKKETLEGDLFNLIDSMYDNRKEEE